MSMMKTDLPSVRNMQAPAEKTDKEKYVKPEYELVKHMTFMFDSLKKNPSYGCRQCSNCHGCR